MRAPHAGSRAMRVLLSSAALFALSSCADGAANSAGVWVRVNPATVNAGSTTQITATCGQNVNSATVTSTAFGSVTLQTASTVLSATVTIPSSTPKGAFDVRLTCAINGMASTTLMVVANVQANASNAPGPNTGGGFLAHEPRGASTPKDRTPLLWLGTGLFSMLAAAALSVRAKKKPITASRVDHDQALEPGPGD